MKKKVLFIGNFLSKTHGTIGPTELMAKKFISEGRNVIMASCIHNKFFRLMDMCFKCWFFKYDVISIDVYSSSAILYAFLVSKLARFRNKEIILVLHGGGLKEIFNSMSANISLLFNRATHIITPSHFLQAFFTGKGFDIMYIPNTINLTLFSYKKERPGKNKILWVRAFTETYNPDVAIKTLAIVLKFYPNATLTMVGPDKGNLPQMRMLIKILGLEERISIVGKVNNSELPQYYRSHDVYLNTTSYESFGVALLEAAACGLPIVSTSVGEIPFMWENGKDILLAESIEPDLLAELIMTYFRDQLLYDTIQKNAYYKSQNYSWDYVKGLWDKYL